MNQLRSDIPYPASVPLLSARDPLQLRLRTGASIDELLRSFVAAYPESVTEALRQVWLSPPVLLEHVS